MPTLAEIKHLSTVLSLLGYVFSIFRRKKYKSNPSEMDIEVFIPAQTRKIWI